MVEAAGVESDDPTENTQLVDRGNARIGTSYITFQICYTVTVQCSPRIPITPNFHLRTPSFDEKHSEVRE